MIDSTVIQKLAKLLYYVQRFGDHNYELLGELSGIENVRDVLSKLKVLVGPSPKFHTLGLSLFRAIIKLSKDSKLQPLDFYHLLDGMIMASLKDVLTSDTTILDIVFPKGRWDFVQILELMSERGLISDYKTYLEYKREVYPVDYSTFNFETLTFEKVILDKPRESFQLPDLTDDFKPDWIDVYTFGKKQANPLRSWDEIGKALGLSSDEVVNHYFNHVVGKGMVDAFYTYLGKTDFRITLIVNDTNEDIAKELSRIVTLLRISYLHNDKIYAVIVGQRHMLIDIMEFINKLSSVYRFSYEIYVHPVTPLRDFVRTYSIPYEHFTKENKWSITFKELKDNFEKELNRVLEERKNT
ncbi:hypothetical protein SULI_10845 [Saccharolobus solfataricus]|uniref:Uncharacterized protein n=2 Tax=Saccharolobus solfataricus TaxID=2287 RepID=A0A0E3JZH9_SACSO|nr:hypothetical protein [Saccharolobus solfataricus]AKA75110.1 hypothetical protein SULB_2151 [Saccharolobus solfataricus]AKA77804.1 hypothetical protein SULC_2149 [Saccharolobus solfataricus]AKA80498.1 hypothetical protein SULA_2150 [Saccharolobus solfataricus]AZF69557.1 hypothetical protein SULG_10845 [Saccharolobus solfataricus]AZF72177.1 hypothetical protein SULH_10845 [Saccharolobus solfataricus]